MGREVGQLSPKALAIRALAEFLDIVSSPSFIAAATVASSVVVALLLRLAPMRWGIYLNEFDPFYEYYLAKTLLEKGNGNLIGGIAWWFSWWFNRGEVDKLFWAPHGRDLRASSQLGAPLFSAAAYELLRLFGFNARLYVVHAFVPAVGAASASLFAYLLAKEVWDSSAGVLASVFLACSWPFIYRTNLGAKHEGLAIPFALASITLLVQAARRGSMLRGALAGLVMGLVVLSWGGFLYFWNLIPLAVMLWLLLNPRATNVARAFLPFIAVVDAFIAAMPRFGPRYAFASSAAVVPWLATGASALVLLHRMPGAAPNVRLTARRVVVLVVAAAALLAAAWWTRLLAALPGRILAVILPVLREVGVTTVAEHAVPTWSSVFRDYGFLVPFSAVGALLSGLRYRKRFEDLLMLVFWASAAYAVASMARLTLLFSPAVALLAGYAVSELAGGLAPLAEEKARARRAQQPSELPAIAVAVVLALPLTAVANVSAISATHQPALILSSSVPVLDYNYEYTDWLSALEWIKANVPQNAVIATWWDYGYWISVNTGRNTTCDNATIDSNQIRKIATAFLSSEEVALRIFKELDVSYVVVFEPFLKAQLPGVGYVYFSPAYGGLGGDLAKSYQMARWIGADPNKYVSVGYIDSFPVLVPADTPEARNATLYHLLFVKTPSRQLFVFEKLPFYGMTVANYRGPSPEIPPPRYFKLVYASQPNEWVLVFKVEYPES